MINIKPKEVHPPNLTPKTFICEKCGSIIGFCKDTSSYYLISTSKKGIHNCKFCYQLSLCAIPDKVGLVVKNS